MLERVRNSGMIRTARSVGDRYGADGGPYLAGAIAYFGFLSLFPLLLLSVSVVGFVLAANPQAEEEVIAEVASSVPGLERLVGANLRAFEDARAVTGIIGLAGLVWTGTGAVGAARYALLRIFRQGVAEGGIRAKLWLLAVTIGVGSVALVATGLSTAATGWEGGGPVGVLLRVAGVAVAFGLDVFVSLVAYRVLVRRRPSWRALIPGAIFAAIGWSLLKVAGAWYASTTVERSETVYGAFAATVGVLVLLFLAGRVFVYGAELNAVLMEQRGGGPMGTAGNSGRAGRAIGDPRELSTMQLVGRVAGDAGALVRKELELARQEVTEGLTARMQGAAAFGAAAVMGLFLVGFLAAAAAAALALVMPLWAALLIVAGVFLVAAVMAALIGRGRMKSRTIAPEKAKANMKEDVEWARAQLRR